MNNCSTMLIEAKERFSERLLKMEEQRAALEREGWKEILPFVMVDPVYEDYVVFVTGEENGGGIENG